MRYEMAQLILGVQRGHFGIVNNRRFRSQGSSPEIYMLSVREISQKEANLISEGILLSLPILTPLYSGQRWPENPVF